MSAPADSAPADSAPADAAHAPARRLNHPNVVQLHEVIDDAERDEVYLVMELVTGGTLADPIARRQVRSRTRTLSLPPPLTLSLTLPLTR